MFPAEIAGLLGDVVTGLRVCLVDEAVRNEAGQMKEERMVCEQVDRGVGRGQRAVACARWALRAGLGGASFLATEGSAVLSPEAPGAGPGTH